jgi:hypothetical protein
MQGAEAKVRWGSSFGIAAIPRHWDALRGGSAMSHYWGSDGVRVVTSMWNGSYEWGELCGLQAQLVCKGALWLSFSFFHLGLWLVASFGEWQVNSSWF